VDKAARLVRGFFRQKTVADCVNYLAPHLDGPEQESLLVVLSEIAKGEYNFLVVESKKIWAHMANDQSNTNSAKAGAILAGLAYCHQRYAAVRLLGDFTARQEIFEVLWEIACDKHAHSLGGMNNEALHALRATLPDRVEFYVDMYQQVLPDNDNGKNDAYYVLWMEKIAAGTILLAGYGHCDGALRQRIREAITFKVVNPEDKKSPMKYSDISEASIRHQILSLISEMYFQKAGRVGGEFEGPEFRKVFYDDFLDAFLEVFRDDGSFYYEEIAIAITWCDEPRVIDAICDFLERWGGTFLSDMHTRDIIVALARNPKSLVTQRLIDVVYAIYNSPMELSRAYGDPEYHKYIGSYMAREIRNAIDGWREEKSVSKT